MNKKNITRYLEVLYYLSLKQVKVRYKSTFFGFMWALFTPLIQLLVLVIVFSLFFKVNLNNYPVFLMAGLFPWNFFQISLNNATKSLIDNRYLLKNTSFPRSLIPLSVIASELFVFLLSFIPILTILIVSLSLLNHVLWLPNFALLFLALLLEILLLIGITLSTSALEVNYRDIAHLVQTVLPVWFYLTPIIYPLSFVPRNIYFLYILNPMVGIINLFQFSFSRVVNLQIEVVLFSIFIIFLTMIIGMLIFKTKQKDFVDYL